MDCYRRGHFVLEAKKLKAASHTKGFDDGLLRARSQAEAYARALPATEGRPPFVLVVDVGTVIEVYAEFSRSGGTYTPFPDPRSHRLALAAIGLPAVAQTTATTTTTTTATTPAMPATAQPTLTERAKETGKEAVDATERGAKKAYHATKNTAEKAADATEHGAKKAYRKTKEVGGEAVDATESGAKKAYRKTKEVGGKAVDATESGAKKAYSATKHGVQKAGDATANVAHKTADGMRTAGDKIGEKIPGTEQNEAAKAAGKQ